jgi:hypothetical protein
MPASSVSKIGILLGVISALQLPLCPIPVAAQDTVVPQTALSTCAAVSIVSRETIAAGTGLAVSPDGHWLALYVHTNRGGEVSLRSRATGESHLIEFVPPALPAGVSWRLLDAVFSPNSEVLAIRSTGAVWVIDVATGNIRFQIGVDSERQTYPGRLSLTNDTLSVIFWLPESFLADVQAGKDVEVRLYGAATGKLQRTLKLPMLSSEAWTEMELSQDNSRIAILHRATRWPGKARLNLFDAESGRLLWEAKIHAEDFLWASDNKSIFALGSRFMTFDAESGKQKSESRFEFGSAENQKLEINETLNLALGHLALFSRLKRSFGRSDRRETMVVLWRLDQAAPTCQVSLPPSLSAKAWLTSQGEIVVLEESYELHPKLQLLKSAQIVTYRVPAN